MKYYILALLMSAPAFACNSDYDCGYGKSCVKPEGSYKLKGVCVQPVNEYGQKETPSNWGGSYGAQETAGCSFNTDCDIGFKCVKQRGDLEGLCVKPQR